MITVPTVPVPGWALGPDGAAPAPAELNEPGLGEAWSARALTWVAAERDPHRPAVVVKDVINLAGVPTTAGVPQLRQEVARADATVVARIRAAGVQVVAKSNLQPWAVGASGANPWLGTPLNPRHPSLLPGGSSSGSAVAVATGACPWALGTDTGGSVRIPAACCDVIGFKPTTGRIPLDGVLPLSPSLDCIGLLAADLTAAAVGWQVISGEPAASTSSPGVSTAKTSPQLGIVGPEWTATLDPAVAAVWRRLTHNLPNVTLPPLAELRRTGHGILAHEAVLTFARRPGRQTSEVTRLLRAGSAVDAADYRRMLQRRVELRATLDDLLCRYDALVLPTLPVLQPRWTDQPSDARLTTYTVPFNLTGHPVIALPVREGGSAISLQLVGRRGEDTDLLRLAETFKTALSVPLTATRTHRRPTCSYSLAPQQNSGRKD